MNELERILAIPAADRSQADKDYLAAHADELSEDQKAQVDSEVAAAADAGNGEGGDGAGDGSDEEAEEKAFREMISKDIQATVGKKVDALADKLVEKFMSGAAAQRAKAIAQNNAPKVDDNANTRKFFKALLAGDHMALKALTVGTNADGGYTVPRALLNEVVRIANDTYGIARRDMRYIPFSGPGNTLDIPNVASGITTYWTDEKVKKRASQPAFGLLSLTLKKLAVIVPMTDELLEDSQVNLNTLIGELVAESMAMEEDIQFFTGNGTVFTGIINNSNTVVVTLPTGTGPGEITADDLLNMINAAPASIKKTGKFYLSSSVLAVIQKLRADGATGAYIWGGPVGDQPGTIWGRPYEIVDAMDAVGDVATGEAFVIFTDLKKTAIFADKQQIRVKALTEATITDTDNATSINLAQQDMTALRFVERVGYVLALPKGVVLLKVSSSGS